MTSALRTVIEAAEEVLRESIYLGRHERAEQLSRAIAEVRLYILEEHDEETNT